ncbi:hypothetical protein JCM10213_001312 [Rhodosporidiobolus nylandii]
MLRSAIRLSPHFLRQLGGRSAAPLRVACASHPAIIPPQHLPVPRRLTTAAKTDPAAPAVAPLIPFRTHPSTSPSTPTAHTFYHTSDGTWTYLVVSPSSSSCVIIDPTLDFSPSTFTISASAADGLLAFIEQEGLKVERILETHAHADHLTAAAYLQSKLPSYAPIGASTGMRQTQAHFGRVFDVPQEELEVAFDEMYEDGQEIVLGAGEGGKGGLKGRVLHLPGHTACSAAYVFGEYVFVGDTIFLPTLGSARADFPAGSAHSLYTSSQRLLSLPPSTRLFSGHHYPSSPSENVCSATVKEHREKNKHLHEGVGEEEFVRMREERDKGLKEPGLLWQSLQVNIRAGRLPRSATTGEVYLRMPVKGAPDGI